MHQCVWSHSISCTDDSCGMNKLLSQWLRIVRRGGKDGGREQMSHRENGEGKGEGGKEGRREKGRKGGEREG